MTPQVFIIAVSISSFIAAVWGGYASYQRMPWWVSLIGAFVIWTVIYTIARILSV